MSEKLSIIGAAILDVLAYPVSPELFEIGSRPVEQTRLSFGGDALNEAAVLSKLGASVELISKVGDDTAGDMVLRYARSCGIDTAPVTVEPGLITGTNIVLTDAKGERYFLTNPTGSLRTLKAEDILPHADETGTVVCFASLFVSSAMGIPEMTAVLRSLRRPERILCADITKAKHGEHLEDLSLLLPLLDYIFPNESEIALLTGDPDPERNARRLVQAGVGCAVIKLGAEGCLVCTKEECFRVPCYPSAKCVDTTGAGDTFVAGFLYGLSKGMSRRACARFANAAASLAIERLGATEGVTGLPAVLERMASIP